MAKCKIDICDKRSVARGWCQNHWHRWRKHGDPLGGRTPNGEPLRYFNEVVLAYDGNECLPWPYATTEGYGVMFHDGRMQLVSRLVCEEEYGPPPTPDHEAAHSCGQGDEACCTKRHLSWKTHIGNEADKIGHGTLARGEKNGQARLTSEQVRQIRALKGVVPQREIAARLAISVPHVSDIQSGKKWAWLT